MREDEITPGYSPIKITNKITNINQYPEYNFVVFAKMGHNYNDDMCHLNEINLVGESGVIKTPYYKFCQIDVFAIKKSDYDEKKLNLMNSTDLTNFLKSGKAIKVIENINHYEERANINPVREEIYEYEIDLGKTLTSSTKSSRIINYTIYYYILFRLLR